jgi:hypothetical protein
MQLSPFLRTNMLKSSQVLNNPTAPTFSYPALETTPRSENTQLADGREHIRDPRSLLQPSLGLGKLTSRRGNVAMPS